MRKFLRGTFVILFSALFCILMGVLLAHAEEPVRPLKKARYHIRTYSPHYPVEIAEALTGIEYAKPEPFPWYSRKADRVPRIFKIAQMEEQIRSWDTLDQSIFFDDLDSHGAQKLSSLPQYRQFTLQQLQIAEREMKKLKVEP